ncbi:hypothetical protein E1A91_D04G220600v1 [Gossypium mustelinum]|uniref:Prolyl 4-hydroxylase alpha subunit Fe(2+) 2OG dioxygenase domain-containing protein n=2 Tax=Gossypium TaxID=3633 RepID=A0A5D2VGQ0_GOSMU|nr:hypothetical protein ES288_D04G229700v1 [Gossypium darwinii]TYI88588.1 hypothetical protein E1A91_D04G220600v1 [Gossypium mustelinum]
MADIEMEEDHPRLILHNFLTEDECKELEFIHKSCSTIGYRPNVFSTTLSHLIATNSAHLIIPFLPIRDRLKEKVEETFGCEYELVTEFTGLISWSRGASIGWHSDDNRPYLKQRDFTAVCYLNSYGKDFEGGLFHFQDGEPKTIAPMVGDAVIYTADGRNTHSVDEDIGFDIRLGRLHALGFDVYYSRDMNFGSDLSELLMEPMQLARRDQLLDHKFVNVLHSLQVAQFYFWEGCKSQAFTNEVQSGKAVRLSRSQSEKITQVGVNRDIMLCVRPVQLGGVFYKISWTAIGIV